MSLLAYTIVYFFPQAVAVDDLVSQTDEKPPTAELDDTAIPYVKIKITELPHEKKPNTVIP